MPRFSSTHAKIYLLLALYAGLLCAPLLAGRMLYWGDVLLYFLPMSDFMRERFLLGEIPLWNPHVLLGQPLLGNPQMGVFYPPNVILFFVPAWAALSFLTVLHLFLCGVFCFHFLRAQKLGDLSSLVGALTYAGSSAIVARIQFPPMVQAAPYLPLLLLTIDRMTSSEFLSVSSTLAKLELKPTPPRLLLTVTVALMVLASHPQMAFLSLLAAVPYAIYRVRQRTGKWLSPLWIVFAVYFALGVGLCAVQLLPTLQLLRESPREQMTPEMANRFFLEARQLLTLLFPRVLGHPAFGDYKAAGNAWEPAIFVGWLPLLAAGLALRLRGHLSATRFWLIVAGVNLWLAFGVKAYLFRLAFYLVPGVSKFHDPARFLFPLTMALVVLGAVGVEVWLSRQTRITRRHWLALVVGTALPLVWSAQVWNPTANPAVLSLSAKGKAEAAAGEGRTYLPDYERLWKRYVNYNDYGSNADRLVRAFRDSGLPNAGMLTHTEMMHGYEPVPLLRPLAFVGTVQELFGRGEPGARRLLELAAVERIRKGWGGEAMLPGMLCSSVNSEGETEFGLPAPRWIRAVSETRWIEGEARTSAALSDPNFNPNQRAILSGEGSEDWRGTPNAGSLDILSLSRTPHLFTFQVKTGADKTFLVFSQVGYPGWRAKVDGKSEPLVTSDGAFCGLFVVGQKPHSVRLEFDPAAYRVGLFLSLMAATLLTALFGLVRAAGRNPERTAL